MSDLNKIDQHTQFKLTNTIQKAATLAIASQKDPAQVLATQLKRSDIPKELAKVATHAFNRRLSITKLAASKDDTKAQDFPLADTQKVQQLLGITKIKKQASLNQTPFVFQIKSFNLSKKASADNNVTQPQITIQQGLKKMQKFIDQSTIAINNLRYQLQADQLSLHNLIKKASAYLQKEPTLSRQLSTVYGNVFSKLFSNLPQQHLSKYASYCVIKKTTASQLVQKAINLFDSIQVKRLKLDKMANYLNAYCSKASSIQSDIKQKRINGLVKLADGWTFGKQILANTILNPGIATFNTVKDTAQFTAGLGGQLNDLASTQLVVSPQSVLTAELLAQDKYTDSKEALAMVLAHPSTKNYKTRQIQRAVNDVLVEFPQYRSPRYAQHLLVAVTDRLAKGGQQNLAGMAAAAQLAKATSQTDQIQRKERAVQAVKALTDQKSGQKVNTLKAIKQKLKAIKNIQYLYTDKDPIASFASGLKQNIVQPMLQQSQQYMGKQQLLRELRTAAQAAQQKQQQQYKEAVQAYLRNAISSEKGDKDKGHYGVSFDKLRDADKRQNVVRLAQARGENLLTAKGYTNYQDLADILGVQLRRPKQKKGKDK